MRIFDAVYRIQQKLRMFPRMLYLSPLRMIGSLDCRAQGLTTLTITTMRNPLDMRTELYIPIA